MIAQPRFTDRLFSRRLLVLSLSPRARRKLPRARSEMGVREFLTLGHFMAYGEPASFELSVSNLVEEPWPIHGSSSY